MTNNPLLELFQGLSECTRCRITPQDVGDVLGYGATQIKEYKRALISGKEMKRNKRLERAAEFAVLLGRANGFDTLFPYITKLSADSEAIWNRKISGQLDRASKTVTEEHQLTIDDLEEVGNRPKKNAIPDYVPNDVITALNEHCDLEEFDNALSYHPKHPKTVVRLLRGAAKK